MTREAEPRTPSPSPPSSSGMAVDSSGAVAYDPSANVKELNAASTRRIDDLAASFAKYFDAEIEHVKELAQLRAEHAKEMRALDADRLEKVRLVDQLNAAQLAQQIRSAVETLATTSAATAETLRNQATATAAAVAAQAERVVNPITERLAALERASYTGQGRQAIADPQMERLSALVEKLATTQTTNTGKSAGISAAWVVAVGAIMLVLAIAGFFGLRSSPPPQPAPQPEIRYLPLPSQSPAQSAPASPR